MEGFRYQGWPLWYHSALLGLALVAAARGDFESARETASYARAWAREVRDPRSLLASDSFEVRLNMLSKGKGRVTRWDPPSYTWFNPWLESPYLTGLECSIYGATSKQCAKVLPSIEEGLRRAKNFHHILLIIEFLAVKALALWGARRHQEGLRVLRQAIRLGEPRGFVRSFVDRAPSIIEPLQALLQKNPENGYLQRLVTAHARVPESAGASAHLEYRSGLRLSARPARYSISLLSDREIDVLLRLAGRMSNKEIAQCLFVSPETVKKHTVHIYRKLEVHNRREAVAAARRMGLLDSSASPEV